MRARWTSSFPGGGYAHVPGIRNVLPVTTPVAGSEWTFTLPGGYYWRLLTGQATLITSGTVANRFPGIQLNDSNVNLFTLEAQAAVVAGSAVTVTYVGGALVAPSVVNTPDLLIGAPAGWLEQGYIIRSITPGLQAGDAYAAINLWWECLDFGVYGEPERIHHRTFAELESTVEPGGATIGTVREHYPAGERG
jgi:hypothetical protein